ncbi:MAG: glycosyltransferase family 39 protein [Anaerolineae bacterium]
MADLEGFPRILPVNGAQVRSGARRVLASRWVAVALVWIAFALRTYRLGAKNIWWDEGLAVWAARKPFAEMTLWTAGDVHPPLYFWFLWPWIRVVGESEFAVRFLSVVFGVFLVAVLYALAKMLLGRNVANLAFLLVATARFPIWWSQEMRMYILGALLALLSIYLFLRLQREDGLGLWVGYVLATAAALYTLYLSVAVLVVENLMLALGYLRTGSRLSRRFLRRWIVGQAAAIGLFVPWLGIALGRIPTWSVAEPIDPVFVLRLYWNLLTLGISTHIDQYWAAGLLFAGIVGVGAWVAIRGLRSDGDSFRIQGVGLIALALGLPVVLVYLLLLPRTLFYVPRVEARYFLAFAPLFYVLLAWGLAALWRRQRLVGLAAGFFVLGAFGWSLFGYYQDRYLRDELQSMVRTIVAYARPGDGVVLVSGSRYPIFLYYYERLQPSGSPPPVRLVPSGVPSLGPDNVEEQMGSAVADLERVWLASVDGTLDDPEGLAVPWLEARYERPLSLGYGHNALHLFASDASPPAVAPTASIEHPLLENLGLGAAFLGYDLPTAEFREGDIVYVSLYVAGPSEQMPMPATLFLVHDKGQILETRELKIPGGSTSERVEVSFRVYERTPPGRYRFILSGPSSGAPGVWFGKVVIQTPDLPPEGHPQEVVDARVGEAIQLVGYSVSSSSTSGGTIDLDLYWKAYGKVTESFTVFTHLLGEAFNPATQGPVWGQHDGVPLDGGLPTFQWPVGRVIRDRHTLRIDPEAPPGIYSLEVGMYLLESGERLPVRTGSGELVGDRMLLEPIEVR